MTPNLSGHQVGLFSPQKIIVDPSTEVVNENIDKNILRLLIHPNPQSDLKRLISFKLPDGHVLLQELLDLAKIRLNNKSKVSRVVDNSVMNVDYMIDNCTITLKPSAYLDCTDTDDLSVYPLSFNCSNDVQDDDDDEWNDENIIAIRLYQINKIVEADDYFY